VWNISSTPTANADFERMLADGETETWWDLHDPMWMRSRIKQEKTKIEVNCLVNDPTPS
jgi:hypothetical protein